MTMPLDLILVRHGESEANVALERSRQGDHSAFTPEYRRRHTSAQRLTRRGVEQAGAAGVWIRENIGLHFDRYYTSEYLRSIETAALLELPGAEWYREFYLRERDWGEFDYISQEEKLERFAEAVERREIDGFYWRPPNGESMADLCLRVDRVINTLHRECSDKGVLIVCHVEVIQAFQVRLERMPQATFSRLEQSTDPRDRIHNGQVLHYTRRAPHTGKVFAHLDWKRSVCPWDTTLSRNVWEPVERPKATNAELLEEIRRTPRLFSS